MDPLARYFTLFCVAVLWSCVIGLQRPPPRYSQQDMPETSFTCRNKIVGSYYADPETDCQVFHVCVSVAGSVQDYKFLCPNDTAFDQESQTCADWYDVDCEAATLYYASDNFDLYRIGSGLESLHYDSLRSDAEPQDHLQRSETSDPVRSSANTLNRVSSTSYNSNSNNNNNNNNRDTLRGSSSSNYYNRNGKEEDYSNDEYKEDVARESKKKTGVRKVSRKQQYTGNGNGNGNANGNNNFPSSSTAAPISNHNTYSGFYSGNSNNRGNNFASSTTAKPQENYRNQNGQRYNTVASSTYRPNTNYQDNYNNYQSQSTTSRTTAYNAYNANTNYNQQSTTVRPTSYNSRNNYQNYNNGGQYTQSTTLQPSTNYQSNDYTNYQQRNYNNIQRGTSNNVAYQSTTASPTVYNNNNYNNNNNGQYRSSTRQDVSQTTAKYQNYNNGQFVQSTTAQPSTNYQSNDYTNFQRTYNNIQRGTGSNVAYQSTTPSESDYDYNNDNNNGQYRSGSSSRQDISQTTAKYYNNYGSSSYAPTTYSPTTKKYVATDNTQAQTSLRNDNSQYFEKTSQTIKSSTKYYDSTKAPKKATQYNNYDATSNGKYYGETSTGTNELGRPAVGIGFSPASINHLAETPRSTTPVPRRASSATTYNPNNYNSNSRAQQATTPRGSTNVSGSARPFSSTTKFPSNTTAKPKSGKKNDYDYAYYDNAGGLEYDFLVLEQTTGNKESTKIARD